MDHHQIKLTHELRQSFIENVNENRKLSCIPPFRFHLKDICKYTSEDDFKFSYLDFFQRHLMANKPCIFPKSFTRNWESRKEWIDECGQPKFDFLKRRFGEATVPVANCDQEHYSSHPKQDMKLCDYLQHWEDYIAASHKDGECLYLKDWHFTRDFPDYTAYTTPEYFMSDWLNEFWDSRTGDHDDYRFVYMGPKGSWTPFHADVFRSYSWSANICGRKKWILFPPGEEQCLKDKYGHLVYDVTSEDLHQSDLYPNYNQLKHRLEIIQEAGEIIFVPSGWHHQVYNLEDTISINHNWLNGCNVDICWSYIKQCLQEVQKEISDCRDMEGWHQQCQLILKASSGIDFKEFFAFMKSIAEKRLKIIDKHRHLIPNYEPETNSDLKCKTEPLHKQFDGNLEVASKELSPLDGLAASESGKCFNSVNKSLEFCTLKDNGKKLDLSTAGLQGNGEQDFRPSGAENTPRNVSSTDNSMHRSFDKESDVLEYLNHLKFDLDRVRFIVEDMLNTPEFTVIESLEEDAINLLSLLKVDG